MGQAADDAVAGLTCQQCGVFFEKEHGHPVVCASCWKQATPAERKKLGLIKAYHREL